MTEHHLYSFLYMHGGEVSIRHSWPSVVFHQMDLVEGQDGAEEAESGGGASSFELISASVTTPLDGDPGFDASDGQPAESQDGEADERHVDALPSLHGSALAVTSEEEEDQEQSAQGDGHAGDDDGEGLGPRRMQSRMSLASRFHILVADQTQHHAGEDQEDPLEDSGNRETVSSVH